MNWGWKIVVLYSGFVLLTLAMVFFTMNQEVFLVADDYYKQEIEYQDQIDKINNARTLEQPLAMHYDSLGKALTITFPADQATGGIAGKINFFRPSDARLDKLYVLKPNGNGSQKFLLQTFNRGRWRVKIEWRSRGVSYYEEKEIDIL